MKKLLHLIYPATSFIKKGVLVRIDLLKEVSGKKIKRKLRKVLLRVTEVPSFSIEEISQLGEGDILGQNVFAVTAIGEGDNIVYVAENINDVIGAQECCNVGIPPNETHFLLHDDDFYLVDSDEDENGRLYLY